MKVLENIKKVIQNIALTFIGIGVIVFYIGWPLFVTALFCGLITK